MPKKKKAFHMKKGFIFTILILLCSMAVFAEIDQFALMHHLGPKSTTYGIQLKFYTASNATAKKSEATTKTLLETSDSQYLGQIVGVVDNQTEDDQIVYYNVYWTPFYMVNSDSTINTKNKISYSITDDSKTSTTAGTPDSSLIGKSGKPEDTLGNISMKLTIPKLTTKSKTVELFNMNIELTDPDFAKGGDYQANLVMEVLTK